MREKIFMSQPSSIVEAVRLVRRLESARKACMQTNPPKEKSKDRVSVITEDKISKELKELKDLVLEMNKRIQSLEERQEKNETKSTSGARRRDNVVCFTCKNPGHFARDCKMKPTGNDNRSLK